MATLTKNRRRQVRHRIHGGTEVRVEFNYPNPNGRPISLPVIDISAAGFSFALLEQLDGLDAGNSIAEVTLRIGKRELRGDLIVMHVSEDRGVCGALFYPATDEDLVRMQYVLAGIEAVHAAG